MTDSDTLSSSSPSPPSVSETFSERGGDPTTPESSVIALNMSSSQSRPRSEGRPYPPATNTTNNMAFAFLVHSQDTLPNDLPPKIDNKPLVRQKRRRTSPEDQTILESEYQRNSKPDKAARMAIMAQVSLDEKAIQIWFQNRRQNDRRKSKPLITCELNSSFDMVDPMSSFGSSEFNSQGLSTFQVDLQRDTKLPALSSERTDSRRVSLPSFSQVAPLASFSSVASQAGDSAGSSFSDRRQSAPVHGIPSGGEPGAQVIPQLRKSSSHVRLAMSIDGKAEVALVESKSPRATRTLPPVKTAESQFRRSIGLRRTMSEIKPDENVSLPSNTPPWSSSQSSGRSREARTWEFYCDADVRKVINDKIDSANSGSCVDALGLLRARSANVQGSPREGQHGKRSSKPHAMDHNAKRQKMQREKLSRASSSLARLQSTSTVSEKGGLQRYEDWDENKENWAPGAQSSQQAPPRLVRRESSFVPVKTDASQRAVLVENPQEQTSFTGPLEQTPDNVKSRTDIYVDSSAASASEDQDETASLPTPMKNRAAELDCVQNLLSLSQGCWR